MTLVDKMRSSLVDFSKGVYPSRFYVGKHTRIIADKLDRALYDLNNGKSTFLQIAVHPRAGKSELAGRLFPLRLMLDRPNTQVMLLSYSDDLVVSHSQWIRKQVKENPVIRAVYQDINVLKGENKIGNWKLSNASGFRAVTLAGGVTGGGADVIIIDDFVKSSDELQTLKRRDDLFRNFSDVVLTRWTGRAVIFLVIATQWHEDDLHGRIRDKTDISSVNYDENFPQFEYIAFPAINNGKWLFTHDENGKEVSLFSEEKYLALKSATSDRGWAAMYMCDPTPEGGMLFDVRKCTILPRAEFMAKIKEMSGEQLINWVRAWDFAHTDKEKSLSADFTGTTKGKIITVPTLVKGQYAYYIFIESYEQDRLAPVKRDEWIRRVASQDNNTLTLFENTIDSRDSVEHLRGQITNSKTVKVSDRSKQSRAELFGPSFDHYRVFLCEGNWVKEWKEQLRRFDGTGSSHDEAVDNLSCMIINEMNKTSNFIQILR